MWENLYNTLQEYAQELRNRYQDALINEDKIATGELLNSVEYILESGDTSISVSLKLKDYWKYVENGRQPGKFPPIDKIREWVSVKPVLPHPDKNGKLPTEQQLTYLIARKIANEGIEPTNALKNTQSQINAEFEARISEAITQDIQREVDVLWWSLFQ